MGPPIAAYNMEAAEMELLIREAGAEIPAETGEQCAVTVPSQETDSRAPASSPSSAGPGPWLCRYPAPFQLP